MAVDIWSALNGEFVPADWMPDPPGTIGLPNKVSSFSCPAPGDPTEPPKETTFRRP